MLQISFVYEKHMVDEKDTFCGSLPGIVVLGSVPVAPPHPQNVCWNGEFQQPLAPLVVEWNVPLRCQTPCNVVTL